MNFDFYIDLLCLCKWMKEIHKESNSLYPILDIYNNTQEKQLVSPEMKQWIEEVFYGK